MELKREERKKPKKQRKYTQASVVLPADMLKKISAFPADVQKDLKKSLGAIYEHYVLEV